LFIAGCREKDKLTPPVKVYFKIGISPENNALDKISIVSINIEYLFYEIIFIVLFIPEVSLI
jgi:hypothetical protein